MFYELFWKWGSQISNVNNILITEESDNFIYLNESQSFRFENFAYHR
jgi:hypothetical protein